MTNNPMQMYSWEYGQYKPYTTGLGKPVWLNSNNETTGVRINSNVLDFKNHTTMQLFDANGVITQPITLTFGMQDTEHNIMAWTGVSSDTTLANSKIRLQTSGDPSLDWIWPVDTGTWWFEYCRDMGFLNNPVVCNGYIAPNEKAVYFTNNLAGFPFPVGVVIKIGAGSTFYRRYSGYAPGDYGYVYPPEPP